MKKILVVALIITVLVLILFGWLPRDRSWQVATGWDRLEESLKPSVSERLFKDNEGPRIQWLGHSGFLIEWGDQTLLLDPNFQSRVTLSSRYITAPKIPTDLKIDLVCISHAHFDHMSPSTLKKFAAIGKIIVPSASEKYLDEETLPGTPELQGLEVWESITEGKLTITAVPAKHNGCRYHPWSSPYIALGYVISDGESSLYFAGDTAYQLEAFSEIKSRLHPDTAILPIGAYAPRVPFKIHHIDPTEAVMAAKVLGVSQVIPCHFGTYRLTLDEPDWALPRFAEEASQQGLYWSMPRYYE